MSFPHVLFLKETKIIDHIFTSISKKLYFYIFYKYSNKLWPSISDHDAPYIETWKILILQKYIDDFKYLPFSVASVILIRVL